MRRIERLAIALVFLPLVAAWLGRAGPLAIDFNLGPGDAPYLEGFHPAYEIDEKVATHWTSYDASIALPLRIEGGPVDVDYRYVRVFGETAEIEIDVGGVPIDRFSRRGGVYEQRHGSLAVMDGPLTFTIRADSHERQNMGIKLDWVRFELGERAVVRLSGWAMWQPFAVTLLGAALLVFAGFAPARAAALTGPFAVVVAASVVLDPWLTHRLLRGLTIALPLFGMATLGVGRFFRIEHKTLRTVFGFMLVAFVVRAALVNQPDFYYPDLRTHARLIGFVQEAGLDFLLSPSEVIAEHDVWVTEAYGQTYAFPYTPTFHLPFALFPFDYDTLILTLKLAGAAISTIPIALVWAFIRSFGFASPVSWVGAAFMIAIPTYASRLSFAFLPSLFGHAVDVALLYWIFRHLERLVDRRRWLVGGFLVASSQLAYVSGVINISLFVLVLAVLTFFFGGESRKILAVRVLAMGLVGGLVAFVVFYRDFLPMVTDVVSRMLGGAVAAESRYPITGFFETTATRSYEFFGMLYPVLTAFGLMVMFRRGVPRLVFSAWLVTYFLLLLGRAKVPDIFLHGHETLFLTPLVCIASATFVAELLHRGGARRWLGASILAALVAIGFWQQWGYFMDQVKNAL